MSLNRYDLTAEYPHRVPPDVSLIYISASKYGPDWYSILHAHGFTELFYVVGGKGQFHLRDKVLPVSEGDLLIIEPNTEHTETSMDTSPMEYIVLGIDGLHLAPDPQQELPCRVLSFRGTGSEVLTTLRTILRETSQKIPGYELVCQSLVNILLVQIARYIGVTAQGEISQNISRDSSAAKRYIDHHYRENLTLEILAQAVHISKYHLAHVFSREYGISPIQYMHQLRLQECRELLKTTDYSVAQVASMTGFSSPSYFSQRFRRAEGMPPAQYRQKYRTLHHQNLEETL